LKNADLTSSELKRQEEDCEALKQQVLLVSKSDTQHSKQSPSPLILQCLNFSCYLFIIGVASIRVWESQQDWGGFDAYFLLLSIYLEVLALLLLTVDLRLNCYPSFLEYLRSSSVRGCLLFFSGAMLIVTDSLIDLCAATVICIVGLVNMSSAFWVSLDPSNSLMHEK